MTEHEAIPACVRVAVLSYWHVHAQDYARQAQSHPRTELVAVWDPDKERGTAAAATLGVEYVPDLDAVLGRTDIDAVVVTAHTASHPDVIVRAARAGKHIFTEKPLAPTVAEAEEIVRACDDNHVNLFVSLPLLYEAQTQAISAIIASGRLGVVTYARVRLSHAGAVEGWLPDRFFNAAEAAGGALTDLGCHPAYLIQLFLGLRPESVSATYRSITSREVEDNAVVTLGYANQAIGVIETGTVSDNALTIDVFGTKGSLYYSRELGGLVGYGPAFHGDESQIEDAASLLPPFAQWIECIDDGVRANDNLERAVQLSRLLAASNESAATGASVAP